MGPFYMAFPAVSAILIGGASVHRASILERDNRDIPFPGILTMTLGDKQHDPDGHVGGHQDNRF